MHVPSCFSYRSDNANINIKTDKIHLQNFSDKTKFRENKELFGVDGLSLFHLLFNFDFDRLFSYAK